MDKNKSPRTVKEALMAEMIGDMDSLLSRLESMPSLLESSEDKLINTVDILDEAGHRYKKTIIAFTEQAKKDLQDYFDRKKNDVLLNTAEEQRAIMQKMAQDIFKNEIAARASQIKISSSRSLKSRFFELFFAGLVTAVLTTTFLYFAKFHL